MVSFPESLNKGKELWGGEAVEMARPSQSARERSLWSLRHNPLLAQLERAARPMKLSEFRWNRFASRFLSIRERLTVLHEYRTIVLKPPGCTLVVRFPKTAIEKLDAERRARARWAAVDT